MDSYVKKQKKIGIYGFGIVGKSFLRYLSNQTLQATITIYDDQIKQCNYKDTCKKLGVIHGQVRLSDNQEQFLKQQDIIYLSPGIDASCYTAYQYKFRSELSLFSQLWQHKSIAVTGSLGKTTLVYLLQYMLRAAGLRIEVGGNIGIPLLSLITNSQTEPMQDATIDYGLFELSSFQLTLHHQFAPTIALCTNIYPNHLDRHKTLEQYQAAKMSLFAHQTAQHVSLLPLAYAHVVREYLEEPDRPLHFFSTILTQDQIIARFKQGIIQQQDIVYSMQPYEQDNIVMKYTIRNNTVCITQLNLPCIKQFAPNIMDEQCVMVHAVFDILKIRTLVMTNTVFMQLSHRLEYCGIHKQRAFYNDSKSTVMEATCKAVQQLATQNMRSIILFLGGTSKGVNRQEKIKQLIPHKQVLKYVICFGQEASLLSQACQKYSIASKACQTFEQAFALCLDIAQANDTVLFSPGGASFDLFSNYVDRGNAFKQKVAQLRS